MSTSNKPEVSTRSKSPSLLIRDKALELYADDEAVRSPVERRYASRLVITLVAATGRSRMSVYRWLADPDGCPLTWPELCSVAEDLGGGLRCMFSVKHA